MNNTDFENMIDVYTDNVKKTIGINQLGFVSDTNSFCVNFMSYMFIHFKNIYNSPYIAQEVKSSIDQLYNYITN